MFNSPSQLVVNNNFMIPQIWRILRQNHIQAEIILPVQMHTPTEKWKFETHLSERPINSVVTQSIIKHIEPTQHVKEYPYIIKFDYSRNSIKKCLDWLTENLEDDQYLIDDFRGEKSPLMDSRSPEINIQGYWAMKTVAIFFTRQEDMNLFKVLKENFHNDN